MSSPQTSQLLRSAPYFPVADVDQSADHYERVLGFRREYVAGTPAQFAILSRDGLAIMLRRVEAPERISPNERQGGTWDAFFWVRDARALHAELRANGAEVVYGPMVQEAYPAAAAGRGSAPGVRRLAARSRRRGPARLAGASSAVRPRLGSRLRPRSLGTRALRARAAATRAARPLPRLG
jgi:catechol 2,3-dioxygenase-like lactoylglutathione lyase family enzyme